MLAILLTVSMVGVGWAIGQWRKPTPIEHVPTAQEKLLRDAGFIDLRGTEPPPLTITDAKGNTTKLSDHRGKLVLLHFWGTGCVHCIKEMPTLNDLQKLYKNQMVVLHVCADGDDSAAAQELLDQLAPGTTAYTDANGIGIARFEAQTLPTVWLIGPDAKSIGRASGARNWQSPILLQLVENCCQRRVHDCLNDHQLEFLVASRGVRKCDNNLPRTHRS
jgi:thiol-disulfide isomerase/thioredoxin